MIRWLEIGACVGKNAMLALWNQDRNLPNLRPAQLSPHLKRGRGARRRCILVQGQLSVPMSDPMAFAHRDDGGNIAKLIHSLELRPVEQQVVVSFRKYLKR